MKCVKCATWFTLRSASSDASFRRYLRIDGAGGATYIVMDAPPPQEDVRPFVAVAAMLQGAGLHAPRVLEQDAAQGFLLLTDLGSRLYLDELHAAVARRDTKLADTLMRDAIAALVQWQSHADASSLAPYDDALLRRELADAEEQASVIRARLQQALERHDVHVH